MIALATGGCLCGAVRYRVAGPLRDVVACHCTQCRRTSGHHVAATQALERDMDIVGRVTWYASSKAARRGFCGICGANLFWQPVGGAAISIMAGTLDAPTGLRLRGHIFVAEKADYYTLPDRLPQAVGDDAELTQP